MGIVSNMPGFVGGIKEQGQKTSRKEGHFFCSYTVAQFLVNPMGSFSPSHS